MKVFCCSFMFLMFSLCHSQQQIFEKLSSKNNELLQPVFNQPEYYELQIIYTQIDRNKKGEAAFTDFTFQLNPEKYFYPASTVKLPIAALALEKLKKLSKKHPGLNRKSPYFIEGDTTSYFIEEDIEAIFAVSDNEAYNRLFEFLGPDYINGKLKKKGLSPVRISHRLSTPNSAENRRKFIRFKIKEDQVIKLRGSINRKAAPLKLEAMEKGVGYYENDSLINKPFDFSLKNYFPLQVQHQLMKQLIFPENYNKKQRFNLSREDRDFLLKAMSRLPKDAGYPDLQDSYVKFFMFGDSKEPIPENIKIFNKVGYAYGTLTETAYIKDESSDIEFLLSATLLVNKNGIFNDDTYEFESIGIPFLAALGREIYEMEINRKKK